MRWVQLERGPRGVLLPLEHHGGVRRVQRQHRLVDLWRPPHGLAYLSSHGCTYDHESYHQQPYHRQPNHRQPYHQQPIKRGAFIVLAYNGLANIVGADPVPNYCGADVSALLQRGH